MSSTVLVPTNIPPQYAATVADAVVETEEDGFSPVLLYTSGDKEWDTPDGSIPTEITELAARNNSIRAARERFERADINCRAYGATTADSDAGAICQAIEDLSADRVYMFGRRRSPAGKAVFGSTLQDVILNSPVPVVVVPSLMS